MLTCYVWLEGAMHFNMKTGQQLNTLAQQTGERRNTLIRQALQEWLAKRS